MADYQSSHSGPTIDERVTLAATNQADIAALKLRMSSAENSINNKADTSTVNAALATKQNTLVSGTNIKTVGGQNVLGSGDIPVNDENAVKFVAQTLTDAQKAQARTNIDAASTEEVSQLEAEKFDKTLDDNAFYITDAHQNIIARIDSDGVSTIDVMVKIDGELVSVKSLLSTLFGSVATEQARAEAEEKKKLDHTLADNKFIITDADGNIIVKVDKDGIHSAMSKHAVACMVFGEYYYPTSAPTRDANGNITHAEVMFGTGVAGSVDITYSGVNAVQVLAHYGDYTYTVTIQRDENGNVEVVSVN